MSSATTRLSAGSTWGLCPGAVSPAGACPRIFVDAFSVALVGFIGHACARHHRLHEVLPPKLQRAMDLGREKGALSWLVTLPIEEYNFALPKGSIRNALCLSCGWTPPHLPSYCVCGSTFSTEHALSCPCVGLPSIQHNNIRNFTAKLLSEICPNVEVQPALQPPTGERLTSRTAISGDEANLDVRAHGFWRHRGQCVYFLTFGCLTLSHQATPDPP